MQKIIVKVNNATQVVAEHTVITQDGKPTIIKASQKVNYEFFDTKTGYAPQHIVTKRVDNDLHVSMQGNGEESDLIIEGFYDETDSALIGLGEDGQYHYYLPDSGDVADYITELIPGSAEGQVLGSESYLVPWWVGATQGETFNALPWLVGLAGVGIVGAASSSDGSSSSSSVPPSQDEDKLPSDAKDAIDKAVQAEKEAQDAIDKANEDGVITPEEQQAIENANKALEDAKKEAQDKIDQLPDSTGKKDLQDKLDEIGNGVDVPEATDKDGDGLDDATAKDVQEAIDKVKEAEQAAKDALDKANEDGVITPEEQQAIEDANKALEDAKKEAQDKIDQLSDSTGKKDLQDKLDEIGNGVEVPAVTDSTGDGLDDAAAQDAQDAIDKAKDAQQAAQDALDKAKEDGVITPEEQQAIEDANKALEDAKKEAQDKIDQLPDSTGKDDLQGQLNEIGNGVDVPEATDKDGDGVDDATAETIQGLIDKAIAAEEAANKALEDAKGEDGLITPAEQQAIENANKAVADAKDTAQQEINKLDPSKGKEILQGKLDAVNGVEVPAVNDKNSDDIDDLTDAQNKVAAAEEAQREVEQALKDAQANGSITQQEHDDLQDLQDKVVAAKKAAQEAINLLDPSKDKEDLQAKLGEVDGIVVPAVTDSTGDGLDDAAAQDAQDAIDKAKDAQQAAQDALDKAKEDGVITPEEQQAIEDANKALEDAKKEAQDKIDQLPDSTGKDDLQGQLNEIGNGVDVPEATDKDGDGVDDATAETIQGLIDKAIAAEEAANKALEDAKGEDGLITPAEQQAIENANKAVADAKDTAQQEINKLDPSKGKETLQGKLDAVNGVEVPAVNDKNSDDIDDLTDAQNKVAAAEEAQREVEQALKDAQANGSITQQEHDDLQDLQDKVVAAKKAAQEAINLLDPSKDKEDLQAKLGEVDGIVVPAVTDSTGDGLDDAAAQDAQDAIDKAKEAQQAAQDALDKAKEDGVITPEEQQAIEDANKALEDAKQEAKDKIDQLPDSTGKDDLQGQLNEIGNGVDVPEATDKDGDGVDDATAETIQGLIDKAIAAEEAANKALEDAKGEDGLITPAEQQAIENANKAVADAKDTAQQEINKLDPSKGKETLQGKLDAVNGVEVPAVNDKNSDDIDDLTDAQNKVAAAEEAQREVEQALKDAQANGSITQQEHDDLQDLQDKVVAAKKAAQEAINLLDPSKDKEDLQAKLGEVDGIVVPAVTDSTGDGLDDAAAQDAQDAIDKAKEAQQAAQDALDKAKEDGVITPEEQQAIEDANKALEDAKQEAKDKIDQLPDSTGKDDLQGQLNEIGNGVDVPEATDKDGDGVDDATAETIQGLIDKAIAAEEAANKALEDAKGEDGLITPAEQQAIENANKAVADAKDTAQQEINKLDPSKGKETLQGKLDAVNGVEVPAVNDKNSDDIDDLTDAQNKVAAAEEAQREVEQALKDAQANGSITQQEHDDLQDLQDKVVAAKKAAQEAINLLDPSKDKEDLQAKLGEVDGIVVPAVTDSTGDGLDDAAAQDAQDAIDKAKDAQQAAQDALDKAKEDGVITPEEQQAIEDANKALEDAKKEAQDKIDQLPDSTGKDDLQGQLNEIGNGVDVPEATDKDGDGVDDATAETIQGLIDKAIAAEEAANKALEDAKGEDGLITPAEQQAIENANKAVADAKDTAQQEINKLDPSKGKETLQGKLDAVNGVEVPAVNDKNSDDIDDLTDAQNKVAAAEEAQREVEQALKDAQANGSITQQEHDDLQDLQDKVVAAKKAAQEAINLLDPSKDKEDLQAKLGEVDGIVVPAVTDSTGDGLDDAAAQDAQDAIDKAKEAQQAAQDALDKAKEDGVITPEEQQAIEDANKALEDAKQEAKDKIDQLPDSTGKDDLQGQLNEIGNGVDVPEATDKDGDGVDDATAETIQGLIDKAIAAEEAANKALEDAKGEDGLITPAEQEAIENANKSVADAKDTAQQEINKLDPSKGKEALQGKLDAVNGVEVPAVNDKNSDDIDDLTDAQNKVAAAEEAQREAEQALKDAEANGSITQQEHDDLQDLQDKVVEAKQAAQEAINLLDPSKDKEDLQAKLGEVDGIVVPAVTDSTGDGLDDAAAQDAQDAIDKAKDAQQAAQDALDKAKEDGVITPEEQQAIEDANKALEDAKQEAKDKIDQLPDSTGKDDLQGQLNEIGNGVDVPEATDKDGDGVDDATAETIQGLIDKAIAAEEAANKALEDAKGEDGLITPAEQQAIENANKAVADAKDTAQQEINKLDPSKGKETLQGKLDAVNGVEVPAVNDKNSDDIDDLTDAQNKVAAAEEAQREAEQALKDAQANGSITQQEHDDLQDLQDKVVAAKKAAQEAINLLDPSKDKEDLQAKLGEVDGIVVPAVTDSTGDGLDDAAAQDAQDAIDKAKEAQQAAQDALDKAKEDGVITPEEQQAIEDANKALEDAKQEAKDKIDQLPDSTGKDDLQGQLNEIGNGVDVPEATDKDGDGVDDATAETIQGLIDKAIAAEEAAKAKLEEVKGEDGLITPAEQEAIENANKSVADAKDTAQQEINKLDPSKGKEALQGKLDAVNGVEVPAVNDKNSDDIDDLTDAQNKVAAAEEAQREAEQALKDAEANGSITQQEHDDLQDLQDKVVEAKQAAQEAINLLDPSKDKEDLQAKLGEVDGIVVPEVTDVTPPETLDAEFNEAGTQVTGTTEPGATVEIKDANGSIIGTAVADEQGDYTADLTTPLTNGEAVTVTATDKAGNTTDPVDATAPDSTAPEAPVVEINEDGTQVTVTGEEGASVTITLPNGGPIEGTIENGSFTAELAPALTNGEDVSVTLTDGSNNESVAGTATAPDLTAPESVTAEFNEAGTQVTGTTEPGATVEIKDANGSIIGTAVADKETGEYTADLTIPLTNGETVTVTATDKAGNSTDPVNATARDTTKPDAPVVEISDTGEEVTVTGEKGTSVSITVPGVDKPITGTIGEEGSFTATLDPALTNGEEVSVTLKDGSGNTSESGTTTAPDLTGPDSITAQITDNGAAVTGQTEAGATVEVKDAAGKTIGTTKANADGNYTILLSPALTNSETITVTATDIAGNPGKSVDAVAPDLTAPSVPTIEVPEPTGANGEYNKGDVDENGNVTVTIKLPDDAEVDDVLILNGQEIAITEDMLTEGHQESVKPGSEVTASVKDAAGNLGMSATKQLATADTIAPEAPIITVPVPSAGADAEYNKGDVNDDGTITVNIKPRPDAQINDVLTIVVEGSQPVEVTITEDILLNGHDINIQPGSKVTASVKDAAGNVGSSEEATVPTADTDISTPQIGLENDTGSEDTDGITNDGTLSITGTDEGDEIVSVVAVKVDGSRLTLEATSEGSYVLPEGKYEKVVVTTQDAAGNTATAETGAITVDKTSPSLNISVDIIAEDDIINAAEAGSTITITGHVTGEYNADDTVTLTVNGNSNYSGKVTAEGSFSIEVTGSDLAEDSKVGVSVTTTDTAGNQGTAMAERPYEVDVVVPGQPVITFPENIDDNGYINIEENGTGYNVSNTPIRVTLPEGTEAGDIIELSTRLTDENSLETTQSIKIIVSETDITKGYAERLVNINSDTTGSTLEVTATVTDAAGNTSQDGTASIMIDTIAPQVAIEFDGIESSGSDSESYIATDSKHEVSFIFNEPVENFDLSKVNITSGGGTLSDLTGPIEINGEYVFKAIYTAPSSIPIGQESIEIELSIGNDVATDAAGNGNKDANDANNKVQIVVSKPAELESLVIKDDFISSSRPGFENTASNHYGVEGAYTGVVADSSVSNEQTELKGITNDTTPVVSIVLDGPVLQGQKVTVTGMQVDSQNNIIGDPIELDIANASMETNRVTGQVTYSWANEALPITDTKGREFVYKASITEVDGVTETANKEVSFILDTVAESPVVTGYDIIDGQGVITGKYSEPGGKVFVDVNKNGIFNFDEGEIATTVDQNGEWKLTLTIEQTKMIADIKNYNGSRSNPEVIEGAFDTYLPLSFVDKAGNTSTEFAEFYYFNNNDNGALSTSDLVPADRPETATGGWIEGQTGDYDGDGVGNWELRFDQNNAGQIILVERNIATYSLSAANRFSIITGKGDDVMIVKGVQNTNTSVYMGEGNDVYSIARLAGSGNAGSIVVDMGSGHNKILINGQAANDAIDLSTIKALGGDDLLDVTGGGIRRSNIDLGDGNNQILTYNLGGLGTTNITTGKDNDYLKVDNAVSSTNINLGDGINKIDINKYINSSTSINTGKHADTVNIGTYVSGSSTINLGGGDNTLTIGESVSGSASIVTGTGKDTVDIKTYLESASVKLGDGDNTLNIGSYVSGSASIKTGNDADTVTIGSYVNNSTVDLGDGGNTLTIGDYVSNSASIITGTGKDTVDIKNYVDNATIKLGDGGSELNIGTSVTGESYIETGSGKDIVTIGNEILHTTIDLGDGDNELTTGSDLRGTSSISAGSGNDIITIGGEVTSTSGGYLAHKVKIEAGDGDNVITVGKKEDAGTERGLYAIHGGQEAFIITGKDKDIITVHGDMVGKNAIINSGAGNDTVNVGGYAYAEAKIYTGEGRDTVNINYLGSSGGAPLVDTGADNDEVTIGTFSKGDIVLGAGEDKLSITTMTGGTVYTGTKEANEDNEVDTVKVDNLQGGIINLGANDVLTSFNNVDGINMTGGSVVFASGDDSSNTVKFNNLYGGTIDLGSGDDVIEFAGNNKIIDMTGTNNIKGGTGVDTLVMTGSGNSISANELFSVEIVDLGNKGNTFNTGLALAYNSSTGNLDSGYKGLFIKGGSNDTVNLGGLGWKDAGTTIEYGGNSYFEYSASNRTIYIDTNIEPVL